MVKLTFCAILLVVIISCVNSESDCGKVKIDKPTPLIVSGEPAYHGQFPWLAPLFHSGKYICGSSIISQWHLLTAAHCVNDKSANKYHSLVGRFDLTNSNELHWKRKNISAIYAHEDFEKDAEVQRSDGDIAILRVTEKINYSPNVQPVCLPEESTNAANRNGMTAGYGKTEIYGEHQNTPSYVTLKSISSWRCGKRGMIYANIVAERSFCAGDPANSTSIPCQGDSGGAFLVHDRAKDQYTMLGIVSFSIGRCNPRNYVAFADVTQYIQWINETIEFDELLFGESSNSCENVDCGDKGECQINGGKTECVCSSQYSGIYPQCEFTCSNNSEIGVQQPMQPEKPSQQYNCDAFVKHCDSLHCPYGILKSYNSNSSCEECECEEPCLNHKCDEGSKCLVNVSSNEFVAVCREFDKRGKCPPQQVNSSSCEVECKDDADCLGDHKCCASGCSSICTLPIDEHNEATAAAPSLRKNPEEIVRAVELEDVPEEDLRTIAREGGIATLRCFATGFPKPSIIWKRQGIELKTNQGRFLLTSNGDLQIIQLHRTDAGTYECVVKSVQREINLTVDEPVEGTSYIVGEKNSTVIADLSHPASFRCAAGGYPKPFVTWWHGDKILELKNDNHEIARDYSLMLYSVNLHDLGLYTCQAYNAIGTPVSVMITLKARGSVQPLTDEDYKYMQYIVTDQPSKSESILTALTPTRATQPPRTSAKTQFYPKVSTINVLALN